MNELQKNVITSYMKKNFNPTLKKISKETGIQITRVFRILNGSEMKISELEKFSVAITDKQIEVENVLGQKSMLLMDNKKLIQKIERIRKISRFKKFL